MQVEPVDRRAQRRKRALAPADPLRALDLAQNAAVPDRRRLAVAAVAAMGVAIAASPASACSISFQICPKHESWNLDLVDVAVISDTGDTDGPPTVWDFTAVLRFDEGRVEVGSDGAQGIIQFQPWEEDR